MTLRGKALGLKKSIVEKGENARYHNFLIFSRANFEICTILNLLSANAFKLDQSKIFNQMKKKKVEALQPLLWTHCRLTDMLDKCSSNKIRQQNFILIQIESSCRPQNKYDRKPEICFSYNRKHYRKKEKMLIKSIFSISQDVF